MTSVTPRSAIHEIAKKNGLGFADGVRPQLLCRGTDRRGLGGDDRHRARRALRTNAHVTGRAGADNFDVEIMFAVGPLQTTAEHRITLAERHDATHRDVLTVVATGSDGDTPPDATITIVLTQATDRTDAAMQEVSGVAALIGDDTLAGFAADTITTFATNLEALLAPVPPRRNAWVRGVYRSAATRCLEQSQWAWPGSAP